MGSEPPPNCVYATPAARASGATKSSGLESPPEEEPLPPLRAWTHACGVGTHAVSCRVGLV